MKKVLICGPGLFIIFQIFFIWHIWCKGLVHGKTVIQLFYQLFHFLFDCTLILFWEKYYERIMGTENKNVWL